jgi:hypothetical protein
MSNESKCKKHTKCNSEYIKCVPNPKKKIHSYSQSHNTWKCRSDIIHKYFPPKKSSKHNPKHTECFHGCHKNRKGKSKKSLDKMNACKTQCNKKIPTKLIYNYGKLVDKLWEGQKRTKKGSKKIKKVKKNGWFGSW